MKIDQLRTRLEEVNNRSQEIRATAEAGKRDLTLEESSELKGLLDEFDQVTDQIETLTRLEGQTAALTASVRKTQPDSPGRKPEPTDDETPAPAQLSAQDRKPGPRVFAAPRGPSNGGFHNLGEMAYHVWQAGRRGGSGVIDPRLERLAAASTYGNESAGSDGGFAIPPDFRDRIMSLILAEDSLVSRCDRTPIEGNHFNQPVDETTPWQTSGGVQTYWGDEATAYTQSKPSLQSRELRLAKLYAFVPMTDEVMEDAAAMDAHLRRKVPEKIAFAMNKAIVSGLGVKQPLGILNAPCTVSVAKESSQTADTLIARNVIKMYSRMYAPSRRNAVWIVNQDIEPELFKLALPGTDNVGNAVTGWGTSVYLPPGGLSSSPYGTLFGRPVIASQACETLGDKGDIIFADLSQYLVILKSGVNPKVETSIHFYFDQSLTCFRFILRVNGTPWWSAAVSARDGSATYSPFVTLDERG